MGYKPISGRLDAAGKFKNNSAHYIVVVGISFHDYPTQGGSEILIQDPASVNVDSITTPVAPAISQAVAPGGAPTTITLGTGLLGLPGLPLLGLFKKLLIPPSYTMNVLWGGGTPPLPAFQAIDCDTLEEALMIL